MVGPGILKLGGVCRTYDDAAVATQALSNISIEIGAGEFVAITGPSGSGKSTLLSVIGLIERATNGSHLFFGADIAACPDTRLDELRRDRIGFVFQNFNLIDDMTAAENVEMGLAHRPMSAAERRLRTADALDRVGISCRVPRPARHFSGGQRQRIALARALAAGPSLILADEPTGHLDRASAEDVIEHLARAAAAGTTVIMATHSPSHAAAAQRCIDLRDGRVVGETLLAA